VSFSLARFQAVVRAPEIGLILVITGIGLLLTLFGGTVQAPRFERLPDGTRSRVFVTDSEGTRVPAVETRNNFLNPQNLTQIAKDTSFIAIMAVGMTFVIVAGQIDLSVGSIYALSSVLGALVFHHFGSASLGGGSGFGIGAGVLTCLGVGGLAGWVNGTLVTSLRVHPFIITLGTMAIYRGIAFVISQGQSIGDFPTPFREFVKWETPGGLTLVPLGVMMAVAIAGGVVLRRMIAGRWVYALGGNEMASRFSGLPVARIKAGVFVVSGLCAGLSALLSLGYYGAATSGDGQGYELNVIAAVVVGGASLTGGRGSALGGLLGALVIQLISSGIVILRIDQNYSQIIIGLAVIVAVLIDQVNGSWVRRRSTGRQL
jgi:ribose transport system permease protein